MTEKVTKIIEFDENNPNKISRIGVSMKVTQNDKRTSEEQTNDLLSGLFGFLGEENDKTKISKDKLNNLFDNEL